MTGAGREVRVAGTGAVGVGGDVHAPITTQVFGADGPAFTVEAPADALPHELADLAALREQPSKLLNARRRVIAFTGRQAELADLAAWRDDGPRRAARLLYAPGGQGKTRLAVRAAEQAAAAGWVVGWARHRTDTPAGPDLADAGDGPLLIVVDYAERWPLSHLRSLLARYARHPGRLRILLLGRSLSWWPTADAECDNLGIIAAAPKALPPLAGTGADRQALFDAACRRFAAVYRLPHPPRCPVPGGSADHAYGSVLTVHMAALAVVDAAAHGQAPPHRPADLSRYLLNREHRYWTALHGDHRAAAAGRAVFLASVTGAVPHRAGAALLARTGLPEAAGLSAQQILDAHAHCYPPTAAGTVLEPLYPDRLAEDFIALTLPAGEPDSLADPWCAGALTERVFARSEGRVPGHAARGLIVLAAAAAHRPHVAAALRAVLSADPALPVEAGGAALMAITPHADATIAAAVSRHITERSIDLSPAAAVLSCGILQMSRLLNHRTSRG